MYPNLRTALVFLIMRNEILDPVRTYENKEMRYFKLMKLYWLKN